MSIILHELRGGKRGALKSLDYFKLCVTYYAVTKSVFLCLPQPAPPFNLILIYTHMFKLLSVIDSVAEEDGEEMYSKCKKLLLKTLNTSTKLFTAPLLKISL
jgi:hypothetical protein